MDGAAHPGQSLPEDKQQTKIKEIHAEVIDARIAIQDTLTKLQERGELMDELQGKTGMSNPLSSVIASFLSAYAYVNETPIRGMYMMSKQELDPAMRIVPSAMLMNR